MGARANEPQTMTNIPGIMVQYPNKNVQTLQQVPWTDVLDLLGSNGEEIMLKLLLDCGIFPCIDHRKGIFYQISGRYLLFTFLCDDNCLFGRLTVANARTAGQDRARIRQASIQVQSSTPSKPTVKVRKQKPRYL